MTEAIKQQLAQLPIKPGVYLFKNRQGNVLYVGKALVLKNRVRSYFQSGSDLTDAKVILVQQIVTIDWIETITEADALVLEDQLIKDYQPRFNILAKDDKSFLYIHITDEEFPRVLAVRRPNLLKPGAYYGPYPFARSTRVVLKLLHSIFPFRTCAKLPDRACLEYYIQRCKAPCIGKINQADYRALIMQVIDFFEGNINGLIDSLVVEMEKAAALQQFERAAEIRDQLKSIDRLRTLQKLPQYYLAEQYAQKAIDPQLGLQELAQVIGLPKPPHRVEVYDISHSQGTHAVGSMVVFTDGFPDKGSYRRFKIKTFQGNDDYRSLQEVIRRRLKRDWPLPDLAIIDGGKGQLSAVQDFWQDKNVPVVALAKQREELFLPHEPIPRLQPTGSQGLFLVQRMRDEAHRFAITYYRKLHKKTMRG